MTRSVACSGEPCSRCEAKFIPVTRLGRSPGARAGTYSAQEGNPPILAEVQNEGLRDFRLHQLPRGLERAVAFSVQTRSEIRNIESLELRLRRKFGVWSASALRSFRN